MSRRDEYLAQRQSVRRPQKTRREQLSGHYTIRHTYKPTPRRGFSPLVMVALILSMVMAIAALNRGGTVPGTAESRQSSPLWQQMLSTAGTMSRGAWGAELLDSCYGLMEDFAEIGEVSASRYMLLLASGVEPGKESEKLIEDIAANEEEAKIYRLALEASYQNMLLLSSGSAPAQSSS